MVQPTLRARAWPDESDSATLKQAMTENLFDLTGKVAVVTGASRGLGQYLGRALARAGADLAITSRGLPALKQFQAEIEGLGRRVLPLELDLLDAASIRAAADAASSHFGKIDVLVNNAGCNVRKPALDVSGDDWNLVLDTNLRGSFFVAQAFARHGPARLRQNHQHRFRHKCLRLCRHRPLLRQPWRHQAAHNEPCR